MSNYLQNEDLPQAICHHGGQTNPNTLLWCVGKITEVYIFKQRKFQKRKQKNRIEKKWKETQIVLLVPTKQWISITKHIFMASKIIIETVKQTFNHLVVLILQITPWACCTLHTILAWAWFLLSYSNQLMWLSIPRRGFTSWAYIEIVLHATSLGIATLLYEDRKNTTFILTNYHDVVHLLIFMTPFTEAS